MAASRSHRTAAEWIWGFDWEQSDFFGRLTGRCQHMHADSSCSTFRNVIKMVLQMMAWKIDFCSLTDLSVHGSLGNHLILTLEIPLGSKMRSKSLLISCPTTTGLQLFGNFASFHLSLLCTTCLQTFFFIVYCLSSTRCGTENQSGHFWQNQVNQCSYFSFVLHAYVNPNKVCVLNL